MSDRLEELRRQRELQKEHLEWLDRQIAELEGIMPSDEDATPPVLEDAPSPAPSSSEDIMGQFRQAPESIQKRTRTGCLIYFILAMAVVVAGFALFYLRERARRGP